MFATLTASVTFRRTCYRLSALPAAIAASACEYGELWAEPNTSVDYICSCAATAGQQSCQRSLSLRNVSSTRLLPRLLCSFLRRRRQGQGGHVPPPKKKKYSGKYFSGNYYVKFGHFVNFSSIFFEQKCLAP